VFHPASHQISSCTSSISEFNLNDIKVNSGNGNVEEKNKYFRITFLEQLFYFPESRTTILTFGIQFLKLIIDEEHEEI